MRNKLDKIYRARKRSIARRKDRKFKESLQDVALYKKMSCRDSEIYFLYSDEAQGFFTKTEGIVRGDIGNSQVLMEARRIQGRMIHLYINRAINARFKFTDWRPVNIIPKTKKA